MTVAHCKALFLAAPASGQGKSTVTAALARYYRDQGMKVRLFKTGPDYLDPQILKQASGQPVEPLDLWMAGEAYCQQALYEAACSADLILIEGAMGLFDGEPSSADLAARFNIPMVIVMDVKGMAQTAAAVAQGLARFRSDIDVVGLIANKCGSQRHADLIREALPDDLPLIATLKRDEAIALPERHLGLVQAHEVTNTLEQKFTQGVAALIEGGLGKHPMMKDLQAVVFHAAERLKRLKGSQGVKAVKAVKGLKGRRIGVANDAAFSFIYDANIRFLTEQGAEVLFFSPLSDRALPQVDALWFPGGYPELHAAALAQNIEMQQAVRAFYRSGQPMLAECGGFLYCLERLTDMEQRCYPMLGLLSGQGTMRGKRGCQGMQTAPLPEGDLRGHAHHRSRSAGTPEPIAWGRRQRHAAPGEAIYRQRGLTATYLHLFFPSNPSAAIALFSQKADVVERRKSAQVREVRVRDTYVGGE